MSKGKFTRIFLLQMEGTVLGERFKADAPTAPDSLFYNLFRCNPQFKKKDVSISLLSDLFEGNKKKQFNKEQILKVNGLVQTGKGK